MVKINTELTGGMEKARELFEELTGRKVNIIESKDEATIGEIKILFRELGKSQHPKVEIKNNTTNTYEKITFL